MTNKVKAFFYSISVKLFLWLWLVLISSVLLSHFITLQLSNNTSITSPNKNNQNLLRNTAKKSFHNKDIDIVKEQKRFRHRTRMHIIFKNLETNEVILPPDKYWLQVREYLQENNFINPASVEFPYTKITGPMFTTTNGQNYHLFIATDNTYQRLNFFLNQFPLWLRLLIVFIISFVLCWLLAKTLHKPLVAIQNAALRLGKGNLSVRLGPEAQRNDELGAVAVSFNTMADQLENNIGAHQRLLADVSHELRSPLTRLQMAIGLAEKCKGNPTAQQKHLTRCEQEVMKLDSMIADVLTLSRLENAAQNIQLSKLNFASLLTQIVSDCQYIASTKSVTIVVPTLENTYCQLDHKLIYSAISNILNNAVKYAPEHSKISIAVKVSNSIITLSVTDHGPGVPEKALTLLFKAFYRVADARDRKSGGTGLGLAIAQQALELHKGTISAQNNPEGGLVITMTIPINQ